MNPTPLYIAPGLQRVTCGPCGGACQVPARDSRGRFCGGYRDCHHCGGRGFVTTTVTVWR